MLRHLALRAGNLSSLFVLFACTAFAANVPTDFAVENAVPGTGFNNPVGFAFTPDGRILVAEKAGQVRVVENGVKIVTPMWDGTLEVLNKGDRGLLGIAVDPDYEQNRYVYLLYSVNPDSSSSDNKDDAFGRLTRYQTDLENPNVLDPASRTVLIGETWGSGFPSASESHAIGALRFGEDGSLFVSCGDGAQYNVTDAGGYDPDMFGPGRSDPAEDIGAFRAQYINSLAGKVLRIDPETGNGYPSNPHYDGDVTTNRARVWSSGLRNPFRFSVRPGTGSSDPADGDPGTLYIGDVGLMTWEEINIAPRGGQNFGWPCYEGLSDNVSFQEADPAHSGCGEAAAYALPAVALHHSDSLQSNPTGLKSNCVTGGVFYTGDRYPAQYRNQLFFADFGQNWIKVALVNDSDEIIHILDFATDTDGPVDFAIDPMSGDVHFLSIYTGKLFRIRYAGENSGNAPPVAIAIADPAIGEAPLTVEFNGSGSLDPENDPLFVQWNFGDGFASTEISPQHRYEEPGTYQAVLTVEDSTGNLSRDTAFVVVNVPFPTTQLLDDFDRPDGPLGSHWVGATAGVSIVDGQLTKTVNSANGIWNRTILDANQEARMTFGSGALEGEQYNLLLLVQGQSWTDGHVQVQYSTVYDRIMVLTYDQEELWVRRGGPFSVRFEEGDTYGARIDAQGTVITYKNGSEIGRVPIAGWNFVGAPGRIGFSLIGGGNVRLDSFGGGNTYNLAPLAIIESPGGDTFFADHDTLTFHGTGIDEQDLPGNLHYQWKIDLHHNNHVHPESFVTEGPTASIVTHDHDDGTGVWLRAHLIVSDSGGLSDTTSVSLYPEIDLAPSEVAVTPDSPGTLRSASYRFKLHNHGRMPAPYSQWRLMAGNVVLAMGDTLVAAMSNVEIEVEVPPVLEAGVHDLKIVVDALSTVRELRENNNEASQTLTVVAGVGISKPKPNLTTLSLSRPYPNPARGPVTFDLALPRESVVSIAVYDVQGREIWSDRERPFDAGEWQIKWPAKLSNGDRARPGLYLARVKAGGQTFNRRIAIVK